MSGNTERFTGRVAEYARYRRRYPQAVLGWLQERCQLTPEWVVADVGAGTGLLGELFLENGNVVVGVEPNAEMRAACEPMKASYPKLRVVEGTAERTGLDAASIDLVGAARAFHWFEPEATAAEFRRVVRSGGWVAIVSNGRREEDTAQARAYEDLLMEYGTDYRHVRERFERGDKVSAFLRRFGGEIGRVEFAEEQELPIDEFVGTTQSLSVAPLRGTPGYPAMRDALEAYFARWSKEGRLRVGMVCEVDVGQVV